MCYSNVIWTNKFHITLLFLYNILEMEGSRMTVIIRSSMLEFLAEAQAMTAIFFGITGESASKIRYV